MCRWEIFPKFNKHAGKKISRNTVILPLYVPLKGQILMQLYAEVNRHNNGSNCSHISSKTDKIFPKTTNY